MTVKTINLMCVNAPSRAFFISTFLNPIELQREIGINALSRAFFISTEEGYNVEKATEMCQCPKSGFLHFYGTPLKPA